MSFVDRLDPPQRRALRLLQQRGYWQPLPGTKAEKNPRLFFPYADAVAFAIALDTLDTPRPVIHVINSAGDAQLYESRAAAAQAAAEGYAAGEIAARTWVVVRRPTSE